MTKNFPASFLKDCEKDYGINFAIALHQLTDWAIHIDWGTLDDSLPIDKMILLRAYVANNIDDVYDFTGIYKIKSYTEKIATRLQNKVGLPVLTRFHNENDIRNSGRYGSLVSDKKIKEARNVITKNISYLQKITKRNNKHIPVVDAMNLTYGKCMIFTYAKMIVQEKTPIMIISEEFTKGSEFEGNIPGFVHAVSFISEDTMEDVWGKQSLMTILKRFGVSKYQLIDSKEEFLKSIESLKSSNPKLFDDFYSKSLQYIKDE